MTRFHVFLDAPSRLVLQHKPTSENYGWETFSSKTTSGILSLATLEAANRRISFLYRNVIFDEDAAQRLVPDENNLEDEVGEHTTVITWPSSGLHEASRVSLLTTSGSGHDASTSVSISMLKGSQSYDYSETSSIARFPAFCIDMHALSSLSTLGASTDTKIHVLLAVIEIENLDSITVRKGVDAGKHVSILRMILGDEHGAICKLTAWREVAEMWSGAGADPGPSVKRGDVVLLENVQCARDPPILGTPMLTASPYLNSRLTICYRTMPYTDEDNRLRPDLRLGSSDAGVRKVADLVQWFEGMAAISVMPIKPSTAVTD